VVSLLPSFLSALRAFCSYQRPGFYAELVVECLSLAESLLPTSEFTIAFHLLLHLVHYMRKWGPLPCIWMFSKESYIGHLARSITNRSQPVAMLTRAYRFFKLTEHYRPEINSILSESPAGLALIARQPRLQLGPGFMRFHESQLSLDGPSTDFTIPTDDMESLRAAFQLIHIRYRELCNAYDKEKLEYQRLQREQKKSTSSFPVMTLWQPRDIALSDVDKLYLEGPRPFTKQFKRAKVGGVKFVLLRLKASSKVADRSLRLTLPLMANLLFVSMGVCCILRMCNLGCSSYRSVVLLLCDVVLQMARVVIYKPHTAFPVSHFGVYKSDRAELEFDLPGVDTRQFFPNRRFVFVTHFVSKNVLAPTDERLSEPISTRLTGKCMVLPVANCVKAVGTAEVRFSHIW
jgi:hypothetical protein